MDIKDLKRELVGLNIWDADIVSPLFVRAVRRDGYESAIGADIQMNRVNVATVDDIITEVLYIG